MPIEMTPEQESTFFQTGELPPEIAVSVEAPPAAPVETPPVTVPDLTPPPPEPSGPTQAELLQRQLIEAERARAATEQQLTQLVEQLNALQNAPEAAPDPTTDPFGHMQHQIRQLTGTIANLQQQLAQAQQYTDAQAQLTRFVGQVRGMRDEFATTTPDFKDAYAYVRNARMADLRDAGVPEHALPAALLQDEMTLAQNAINAGRNPAQVIYDMAKRHGYTAKPAAAATPAGVNPVLAAAQAKLAQVQAGQAAAINVPRASSEVQLTLETLKDASNDDINKLVQSDDLWNKIAGGRPSGKDIF